MRKETNEKPYNARQIPGVGKLIEMVKEGKLSPEGYLDILEERQEQVPESIGPDDLYDLWSGGRLSDVEYVDLEKSRPNTIEELPPEDQVESIQEFYETVTDSKSE